MLRISRRSLIWPSLLIAAITLPAMQSPPNVNATADNVSTPTDQQTASNTEWQALAQAAQDLRIKMQASDQTPESINEDLRNLTIDTKAYLEKHPKHPQAWNLLASLCGQLRDDKCVDQSAYELLEIQPENVQVGLQWAAYYASSERNQRAMEILDLLLEKKPLGLLYQNAWILTARTVDPALINSRFQNLIAKPETYPQAIAFITAMQQSDPWAAQELSEQLITLAPDDPDVIINRGYALRGTNRFAEARELLSSLPEERLADPKIAYLYSDCHYADHDFETAYDIMSNIDLDSLDENPGLKRRLTFMLPLRQTAVEAWAIEQDRREVDAEQETNPKVRLMIDGEPVEIELFQDVAPNTVATFLAMTSRGFYDDIPFGQVQTGFRSIGGTIPTAVPYTIPSEKDAPGSRDFFSGTLATYLPISGNKDSAGAEWCIYHFPAPHLNQQRTVFGRVTSGLDIVRRMKEDSRLDSIEILRSPGIDTDPIVIDAEKQRRPFSEVMATFTLPRNNSNETVKP